MRQGQRDGADPCRVHSALSYAAAKPGSCWPSGRLLSATLIRAARQASPHITEREQHQGRAQVRHASTGIKFARSPMKTPGAVLDLSLRQDSHIHAPFGRAIQWQFGADYSVLVRAGEKSSGKIVGPPGNPILTRGTRAAGFSGGDYFASLGPEKNQDQRAWRPPGSLPKIVYGSGSFFVTLGNSCSEAVA